MIWLKTELLKSMYLKGDLLLIRKNNIVFFVVFHHIQQNSKHEQKKSFHNMWIVEQIHYYI